MTEMKS